MKGWREGNVEGVGAHLKSQHLRGEGEVKVGRLGASLVCMRFYLKQQPTKITGAGGGEDNKLGKR